MRPTRPDPQPRRFAALNYQLALETLRHEARRGPIRCVAGVLNGTCDYALDRCMQGVHWNTAVREAHERGFTEADAAADLGGNDSARKLRILARHAFGQDLAGLVRLEAVERDDFHRVAHICFHLEKRRSLPRTQATRFAASTIHHQVCRISATHQRLDSARCCALSLRQRAYCCAYCGRGSSMSISQNFSHRMLFSKTPAYDRG